MGFSLFYLTEDLSPEAVMKSLDEYKAIIEKKLGNILYRQHGMSKYRNSEGTGVGVRYFIGDTDQAIRFNINSTNKVTSVDIWEKNTNSITPKIRLEIKGLSMEQVVSQVAELIKNPMVKEVIEVDEAEGVPVVKKQQVVVKKIVNEEPIIPAEKEEKKLDSVEYADPKVVFDDMKVLVNMVIKGRRNSLIISGLAGVGKSFNVMQVLNENGLVEGRDYEIIKGKSTTLALYQSLYENKTKLVIYDDCDSILKNKDALNILKGALDSNLERTISWKSKTTFNPDNYETSEINKFKSQGKLPDHFDFRGKVIFITNLYIKQLDHAIVSRSFVVDVTLRSQDILLRIESILKDILKDDPMATMPIKQEVLNYFKFLVNNNKLRGSMNIRRFIAGVDLRISRQTDWKRLVERYA